MTEGGSTAWFSPEELPAMVSFWEVYEKAFHRVQEDMLNEVRLLSPNLPDDPRAAGARREAPEGVDVVWRAIRSGDWTEVNAWLERRGEKFAQMGVSLDLWLDFVLLTQKHCVPYVLELEAPGPALMAMHTFWSRGIRVARRRYAEEVARIAEEDRIALRKSEARFQCLADSGIIGITVTDASATIIDANDAFLELLGYSRTDLEAGALVWDELTPSEWSHVTAQILGELTTQGFAKPREKAYRHKDGRTVPVLVGLAAIDPTLTITFVLDLTERRRLEDQVRQSHKMEAVGALTGGIAHDFNNMLSVILSCCDLVLAEIGRDHPSLSDVEDIRDAAQRSADLVEQLLAFSRKQVRLPRAVNPAHFVFRMRDLIQRLVGSAVKVTTSASGDLPNIRVDTNQLQQILLNLAANARDAMPDGGLLTIALRAVELSPEQLLHMSLPEGTYVELSVSDTGEGMDPATCQRIFEPFFTTKGDRGTGFGLSTVYGILRQSGGAVVVESALGQGAVFRCYFPATEEAASTEPRPTPLSVTNGTETVLLLDDNEAVRRTSRDILIRSGYKVLEARDANHALQLARDHADDLSLLITDLVMPDMHGSDLARAAAEILPGLKVLFVTGYAEGRLLQADQDPPPALVRKPLTAHSLLNAVRRALDRQAD